MSALARTIYLCPGCRMQACDCRFGDWPVPPLPSLPEPPNPPPPPPDFAVVAWSPQEDAAWDELARRLPATDGPGYPD